MKRTIFAVVTAALAVGLAGAPAGAEGGNGASLCSNNGQPDGIVTADLTSIDNPGEAFSYFAPQSQYAQGGPANPFNPGQQVKGLCNPSL